MTALCEHFSEVALDGELVVAGPGGRLDFMALNRRLAGGGVGLPGRASYVVFDALSAGGTNLRGYPCRVRRAVLEQLLAGARPPLAIVPMTTDGVAAQVWLSDHLEAGIEGVVAKRLDHAYSQAKRAWSKVRGRRTAEAVVGGVLGPISAPVALVVGRRDEQGQLRVAGRTAPIPRPDRAGVGKVLRPAGYWHPWAPVLAPSRFGGAASVRTATCSPATA